MPGTAPRSAKFVAVSSYQRYEFWKDKVSKENGEVSKYRNRPLWSSSL
jgi:hypothetical protein